MPRFFVENNGPSDGTITLRGEDARHISLSLRMLPGEPLVVCDMARKEYRCVIERFASDSVLLRIVSEKPSENEPPYEIRLYQATPKSDKLEQIIQKAVECGVGEIIPFYSERCVARPKDASAPRKTERRNRIAAEAGKQCGRARLVRVSDPVDFKTAVDGAARASLPLLCYEGDGVTPLGQLLRERVGDISDISLLIGAEGGFSHEEAAYARSRGMLPVGLGRRILRCETASLFALAVLVYEFEL